MIISMRDLVLGMLTHLMLGFYMGMKFGVWASDKESKPRRRRA